MMEDPISKVDKKQIVEAKMRVTHAKRSAEKMLKAGFPVAELLLRITDLENQLTLIINEYGAK